MKIKKSDIKEGIRLLKENVEWYEYLDWNEFDLEFIQKLPKDAKKHALNYRCLESTAKEGNE